MATQYECKQRFMDALDNIALEISKIDAATPAEPEGSYTPPEWWEDMIDLQRKIGYLKEKHAPGK